MRPAPFARDLAAQPYRRAARRPPPLWRQQLRWWFGGTRIARWLGAAP